MSKFSIRLARDHAGPQTGAILDIIVRLGTGEEQSVSVVVDKDSGEPTSDALGDALQALGAKLKTPAAASATGKPSV